MTNIIESTIRSQLLGNERRIWFQSLAVDRPAEATILLLDGEYYVERMNAPEVIAELQSSRSIPSFSVIYVSHVDGHTRWEESFCNELTARFLDGLGD